MNSQISLAERDTYLSQIEIQILSKRNLLLEKRKTLENTVNQNQFLHGIKNDYQNYHNYIIKQKNDQINAMNILNQYIKDLTLSSKMTEQDIHKSREEQNKILNEMNSIKIDLNNIIRQ
jgi:hypothetical protein